MDSSSELHVKLLLLGDTASGKSSLLMRFTEGKFDSNFVLTIGVDFKTRKMERHGRKLKIQIWDTAGQERFRTITPAYYRSAAGVIICYDVASMDTFQNTRYWMEQLEKHGDPSLQRILIGHKMDFSEDQRQVMAEDGEEFAKYYSMPFFEASARTGENVDEAFLTLSDSVIAQKYANHTAAPPSNGDKPLKTGGKKPKANCACVVS